MKAIPFMTDDEMMELLAANMTIYFEDYQEIKKAYTNSLEGLKDILGNEKYEIIEDLIKAYNSQVASDMVFSYSCGFKNNLAHFTMVAVHAALSCDFEH